MAAVGVLRTAKPRSDTVVMSGGLDHITPPIAMEPGALIDAVNFVQALNGGYRRIHGYERFDGTQAPSATTYVSLVLDAVSGAVAGDTLTATATGATYYILGSDGEEVYVYDLPDGAITPGDTVDINGGTYSVVEVVTSGAANLARHAELRYAAEERRRSVITAVPGVGRVIGIVGRADGGVVAFRDDGAGVAAAYSSSTSGWTAAPYSLQLEFDTGVAAIVAGDTITGATSGATAVVDEVIITSGAFDATTPAKGVLVISQLTGAFSVGENLDTASNTAAAVVARSEYTPSISLDSDLRFITYNFGGATSQTATYFVDRVAPGVFRYDGNSIVFVPVDTGGAPVSHIAAYKQRLYLAAASSLILSVVGEPFKYDAVEGAAEIAVGSDITNVLPERGTSSSSAVIVTTTDTINVLYGDSTSTWQLQTLSYDVGALPDTAVQVSGDVFFASDVGIHTVKTVKEYGNFAVYTVSKHISPLYDDIRPYIARAVADASTSQYKLYCSDSRVLVATVASADTVQNISFTLLDYRDYNSNSSPFAYVDMVKGDFGTARYFAPGYDYVYEVDRGRSFDGADIVAYFVTAFFYSSAPLLRKRYKRLWLSGVSEGYSEFVVQYDVSPSAYEGGNSREALIAAFPLGRWLDVSTWGQFVWSAGAAPDYRIDTPGAGKAISIMVKSASSISDPFTIQSATLQFTIGRLER